ncbi:MAG TPA: hypothetical protein DDZ40_06625 [Deltaproteobacteria bacterium]|nr:hypothetical protein [Deltaproteobacteria bacterium]
MLLYYLFPGAFRPKAIHIHQVLSIDVPKTALFFSRLPGHLKRAGWGTASYRELRRIAESDADALVRGIDVFVVGTIIKRRGPEFLERRKASDTFEKSQQPDADNF